MLQKQPLSINFSQGVDTKTDPFQLAPGKFLSLENSVFDKIGRLTKRNGYAALTPVPSSVDSPNYITTYFDNLIAIGRTLESYSAGSKEWINKGNLLPVTVETLSAVRNSTSQTQADSAVAANGLACIVYTDQNPANLTQSIYKYAIIDSATGEYIVPPVQLTNADATYGTPRVFLLNNYFVVIYTTKPSSYHLVYQAISSTDVNAVIAETDIVTNYQPSTTLNFDAVISNGRLVIAYHTLTGGSIIAIKALSPTFVLSGATTISGYTATMFSLCAEDPATYVVFYNGTNGYITAIDQNLVLIPAFATPITWATAITDIKNVTSSATASGVTIYYERAKAYSFDANLKTNYITTNTVTSAGVAGTPLPYLCRSVGLASKVITGSDGVDYFLALYNSVYQPSYFLINGSGKVVATLANSNGASNYYLNGLPSFSIHDDALWAPYLRRDLIQSINQTATTYTPGVFSQTGINLGRFAIAGSDVLSAEIGNNLNLTGGFLTGYDGVAPVEQGFFLYPDMDTNLDANGTSKAISVTAGVGSVAAAGAPYYYQVTYEWTDNQGNLFRSAPSLPVPLTAASLTGGASNTVTINVPTLRLTQKTTSPVRIVVYRWSTTQQAYYQISSIQQPTLNDLSVDSVAVTDTFSNAQIIGNNLIYTTGGVVENIMPPATNVMTLFDNRLWLLDAENPNLLWFSKQVIQNTPVEMSDLFTRYIAPTTASQGSTGKITALSPMDDKLVIFKRNALGYINGTGPDNAGGNSQYSEFTLINSVVGCTNQKSIVFTPNGLMFQSAKGIWLLGRDLSTSYIGAPVESLTVGANVYSAVNVPGTTQVRFTLDSGVTLMYDYFFQQWGAFTNIPALSSTIYDNLHTYINSYGQVLQETPGQYLDNTSPVLMKFVTGWINLAGLQGFERFYSMYLLGQYLTPFNLNVTIGYDYNPSAAQSTLVSPDNYAANYGNEQLWGSGPVWGGASNVFEARVFPQRQKCESFQLSINEVYDPTKGQAAGAGLTLSGLNLIVGLKKASRTSPAYRNFG